MPANLNLKTIHGRIEGEKYVRSRRLKKLSAMEVFALVRSIYKTIIIISARCETITDINERLPILSDNNLVLIAISVAVDTWRGSYKVNYVRHSTFKLFLKNFVSLDTRGTSKLFKFLNVESLFILFFFFSSKKTFCSLPTSFFNKKLIFKLFVKWNFSVAG